MFLCPIDAEVRLAGSKSNNCSGRVEIFHSSTWGTVCDDHWDLDDAQVVCRKLGCGSALRAPREADYGQGTGPIWLDDVGCSGNESSVTECAHPGFGTNNCSHSEDASVVCSGERILVLFLKSMHRVRTMLRNAIHPIVLNKKPNSNLDFIQPSSASV